SSRRRHTRSKRDWSSDVCSSDLTHWPLADGTDTQIFSWLDDHSRFLLHISAHAQITGETVITTFTHATAENGYPASTLTDNGMRSEERRVGKESIDQWPHAH